MTWTVQEVLACIDELSEQALNNDAYSVFDGLNWNRPET